jgi:hypothetical protein
MPSMRWALAHMIEETGRHAGHLDILRELADGQDRQMKSGEVSGVFTSPAVVVPDSCR